MTWGMFVAGAALVAGAWLFVERRRAKSLKLYEQRLEREAREREEKRKAWRREWS